MFNNFSNDGRAHGSETVSSKCDAVNAVSKKIPARRLKVSPKSKFDFISPSCCSVSSDGRKVLRIKSICRNPSQGTHKEHVLEKSI